MLTMSAVMMPTAQLAAIPSTAQLPVMQTAKFEQKYLLNHNSQMQVATSKPGIYISASLSPRGKYCEIFSVRPELRNGLLFR